MKELGYPSHWVMTVLDELVSDKPLKSKAVLVNQSPPNIPVEKRTNTYNVSAFRLELESRIATWIKHGLLPRKLITFSSLPMGRSLQYCLQLKGIDEYSAGFVGAMCLGFLLERELNPDFDQAIPNEVDRMMAVMMGGPVPDTKEDGVLRQALLTKGSRTGHLFSCVVYNASDKSIMFRMCEDAFAKHKSYHFSLVRTDGWFRMRHAKVLLSDAEVVQ
jgi:hypothetical protein